MLACSGNITIPYLTHAISNSCSVFLLLDYFSQLGMTRHYCQHFLAFNDAAILASSGSFTVPLFDICQLKRLSLLSAVITSVSLEGSNTATDAVVISREVMSVGLRQYSYLIPGHTSVHTELAFSFYLITLVGFDGLDTATGGVDARSTVMSTSLCSFVALLSWFTLISLI